MCHAHDGKVQKNRIFILPHQVNKFQLHFFMAQSARKLFTAHRSLTSFTAVSRNSSLRRPPLFTTGRYIENKIACDLPKPVLFDGDGASLMLSSSL
jgi:hypothetical protein